MSDQHLGYPGAPPGWYPDPAGGTAQRWWDGYNWSEAIVAPAPAPPSDPPPWAVASVRMASASAKELVRAEVSINPVARVALAYPGLASLVLLLFVRVNAAQMRFVGHQIHLADLAAQNNQPAPNLQIPTFNAATNALLSVNWFVLLGAIILCLIWQHHAASAARALGLPTRHSPAWGVGSWFVPVVNFWIPFQALSDCLKAGDSGRGLILRYWLLGVGSGLGTVAVIVASTFNSTASLVLSIPTVLVSLAVVAIAPRVVMAIAMSHHSQLDGADQPNPVGGPVGR